MTENIKCPCCGSEDIGGGVLDYEFKVCQKCDCAWYEEKRQPSNAWIACSERLPKYGVKVAVIHNEFYKTIAKVDKDRGWITSSAKLPIIGVTHWYPLPQLPKTESEV